MTQNEKITWLIQHVPGLYATAKTQAEIELDDIAPIFCFCGKLATGLHTNHCRKFQNILKKRIVEKLKDYLPK